jgi:hypothetical protein
VTTLVIRCKAGALDDDDLCRACPTARDMACKRLPAELCEDLIVRDGWHVTLRTRGSDDIALFVGRLLLLASDLHVSAGGAAPVGRPALATILTDVQARS